MLIVLFTWLIIFLVFLTSGYSVFWLVGKMLKTDSSHLRVDEYFFGGFLSISSIAGLLSINLPMSKTVLFVILVLSFILFCIFYGEIKKLLTGLLTGLRSIERTWIISILLLVFLLLAASVSSITFEDSLTYHAQNIQWLQKYAVVPGLGNLHGRFAFNNMFFVVSAIFTYKIGESVIFPLNGICFLILALRLITLSISEFRSGIKWKALFYMLMLLISLLIIMPNLSSPAPDLICAILVMYSFVLIFRKFGFSWQTSIMHFILLSLIVFSCATYKISSVLLIPVLLFFIGSEKKKKLVLFIIIGSFILLPFLVRNYYQSGYIVYPFPSIDIFNPDWKIPLVDVSAMKLEIESFAKIVGMPYQEVDSMHFYEWMVPWFSACDLVTKILLIVNLISVIFLIFFLMRKEKYFSGIFLIIFLNLVFWLSTAPDPRFVYGFLIAGFALTCAYIIKIIEDSGYSAALRSLKFIILSLAFIIVLKRIQFPAETFRYPTLFLIPARFETTPAEIRKAVNFEYRLALNPCNCCYFTDIPCTTYPLDHIMLRGTGFQDGFRILNPK